MWTKLDRCYSSECTGGKQDFKSLQCGLSWPELFLVKLKKTKTTIKKTWIILHSTDKLVLLCDFKITILCNWNSFSWLIFCYPGYIFKPAAAANHTNKEEFDLFPLWMAIYHKFSIQIWSVVPKNKQLPPSCFLETDKTWKGFSMLMVTKS